MAVFKQRRGTAAALAAANETLAAGQLCVETDTNRIKVGDGSTPYNSLPYLRAASLIADVAGLQTALDSKAALSHTHTASAITDFASAVVAASPSSTPATASSLGVVQIGANITVSAGGIISVADPVTSLPYSSITGTPSLATVATTGSYTDLSNKPTIPSAYTLPTASSTTLGGVKIGSGVTITSGVISVSTNYAAVSHTHTASQITDFSTAALSAVTWSTLTGKPTFSAVAVSGSYADLTGVPSSLPPTTGSVADSSIASSGLSPASIAWVAIQDWASYVSYAKGDLVTFNGTAWRATSAHTSAFAFDLSKWAQMTPSVFDASQITSGTVSSNRLPPATTTAAGIVTVGTGLSVSSGAVSANVTSVAGRTGAVTIAAADVTGLGSLATQSSVAYSSLTGTPPDRVVEYSTSASFPATGSTQILYVATDASRAYRWTGAQYVEVGPSSASVSSAGIALSRVLALT